MSVRGGGCCIAGERGVLSGMGEEILLLVSQASPTQLITDWLNLYAGDIPIYSLLSNRNECCGLRRQGEELLSVVMDRATPDQWMKWLQIPLEQARLAGKTSLVDNIVAAGAKVATQEGGSSAHARSSVCRAPTTGGVAGAASAPPSARRCTSWSGGEGSGARLAPVSLCCKPLVVIRAPVSGCSSPTLCSSEPAASAPRVALTWSPTAASSCCPSYSPCSGAAAAMQGVPANPTSSTCCGGAGSVQVMSMANNRHEGSGRGSGGAAAGAATAAAAAVAAPAAVGPNDTADLPFPEDAASVAALLDENLSLHRAAMARDVNRLRDLLTRGRIEKNATDLWRCTALHRAAEQDGEEVMRLLIDAGLDVGARDMEGYSPLHFAAARGASNCIVHLLRAGAQVSDRGLNGDTPLHSAVRFLSLSTVRLLLEWDADDMAENGEGHTPMQVTGVLPDGRDIEDAPDPLAAQNIFTALQDAPADRRFRNWKRRAWIVMLRARAQANLEQSSKAAVVRIDDGTCMIVGMCVGGSLKAGRENSRESSGYTGLEKLEKTVRCGLGSGVGCGAGGCCGGAHGVREEDEVFVKAVKRTLGLAEYGIFTKIVTFL